MPMINQVFPVKRQVPLDGLYLNQKLMDMATQNGKNLVLTDYLTDRNGVVAKAGKDGNFQVPTQIKNSSDWGRFQELMAQADITISGGSYFKRLETSQDVLYPFEPGHTFEKLGEWRLNTGYQKRSPDVAIVSRELDFEIPEKLIKSSRKILIFTTDSMVNSDEAKKLRNANTTIFGSGASGVDGGRMIDVLAKEMGYRVIMMVSGPHILELLLEANRLDLLYVTEAQIEIPSDDPTSMQTILSGGKKVSDLKEFRLAHKFIQDHVVTEGGSHVSQSFLRYDRKDPRK